MILYRGGGTDQSLQSIIYDPTLTDGERFMAVLDWLGDPVQVEEVNFLFAGEGPHLEFIEVENAEGAGMSVGDFIPAQDGSDEFHRIRLQAIV